jgi:putative flippase GtrA
MAFLKFGSLSGAGWLLDFAILLALVGALGAPAIVANVVSSSIAAFTVFLFSRRMIFKPAEGGLEARIASYLAYTLCVIAVTAEAMSLIVHALGALGEARGWRVSPTTLAAIAKIAITPPTLILNFLMSRHTAEREIPERA